MPTLWPNTSDQPETLHGMQLTERLHHHAGYCMTCVTGYLPNRQEGMLL